MFVKRLMSFCAVILVSAAALMGAEPIRLTVDATDAPKKVLHAHMAVPVSGTALSLYYPKWIPGEHGPTGPLVQMAGLRMTAAGRPIAWSRDPLEMYEFHAEVPAETRQLDVDLDYLDPVGSGAFSGGGSMTPRLVLVSWNTVLLYPAAATSDEIMIEPVLRLPHGWNYATGLTTAAVNGDEIRFEPVTLTRLIDSPVLAGAFLRKIDLPASGALRRTIDAASDSESALITPDGFAPGYGRLVDQARALFGAEHYRHYDWLLTLSDQAEHFGLEHHESSDDRVGENGLSTEDTRRGLAGLLSHEYVHSWNGKYRRPAGLAVANFDRPMNTELLWVYEGLTSYLGDLLAWRSGLWTDAFYRESLARIASSLSNRPGRSWRPLEDTAVEAQVLYGAPGEWSSIRRGVDFYDEGVLLWLDVDMTIRSLTSGKRSLDDFCRRFFGGPDGDPAVHPYTFDDVVKALNSVASNDWAKFLNQRIRSTESAPLGGIANGGWRLVYNDTPNAALSAGETMHKTQDFSTSIGILLNDSGRVSDVIGGSLAATAGIVPGSRLIAVNGRRFTPEALKAAIRDSAKTKTPLQVIYDAGDFVNTAAIDYHGGLRYPHLERIAASPDRFLELGRALPVR